MAGTTVKVAVAELVPSLACTVLAPAIEAVVEPAGTMKDALKEPVPSVVTGVGVVATAEPANVMVTVEEAAKPEPETVTVVPTGPEDGLKAIDWLTVNVAESELAPSVAWTV